MSDRTIEEEQELLTADLADLGSTDEGSRKRAGERAQARIRGLVLAKRTATETATKVLEEERGKHAKIIQEMEARMRSEFEADLALSDAGIRTAFDRKVARDYYGTLDEKNRPALKDWATSLRDKPESRKGLPDALAGIFGAGKQSQEVNPDKGAKKPDNGLTKDAFMALDDETFAKRFGLSR